VLSREGSEAKGRRIQTPLKLGTKFHRSLTQLFQIFTEKNAHKQGTSNSLNPFPIIFRKLIRLNLILPG
jgi:hypothetical protein